MSEYLKQRLPKSLAHFRRSRRGSGTTPNPSGTPSHYLNGFEDLAHFDSNTGRLEIRHEAGFFSICTVTLQALTALHPREDEVSVCWSGQPIWREGSPHQGNLFQEFFTPNPDIRITELKYSPRFNYHGFYEDLSFSRLQPYVRKYFSPSPIVRRRIAEFKQKYAIDPARTIGFCYRGTDKFVEVSAINLGHYFKKLRKALQAHPDFRILIQTDQKLIRDRTRMEFRDKAFFIDELPVAESSTVVHQLTKEERDLSGFELGVKLIAAIHIQAECAYVVTHTGNVGLWTYLFRGHARNCCQLRPKDPEVVSQLDFDRTWLGGLRQWGRRLLRH